MYKKLLYFVIAAISLTNCNDYLDLVPEKDVVSIESIFEKKNTALEFLNGSYQALARNFGDFHYDPAVCGGDEFMTNDYSRNHSYGFIGTQVIPSFDIATGNQNSDRPILDIWGTRNDKTVEGASYNNTNMYAGIRNANTFIANVDKVYNMSDEEKAQHKAEAKAIKAFYYFQLVKRYGPIILMPENIDVDNSLTNMQKPRAHVDTCFAAIVRLFDEAIPYLKTLRELNKDRIGVMNKEAAYAFKAKALVFAASDLFNGNKLYSGLTNIKGKPLFNPTKDQKKWEKAAKACNEAVQYCESIGKELYSREKGKETPILNAVENIRMSSMPFYFDSEELLYAVWTHYIVDEFELKLPRYNADCWDFNNKITGNVNPTLRMVELYYTSNGLPIKDDKNYPYADRYKLGVKADEAYYKVIQQNVSILNLHNKREPRFYASIAFDKSCWKSGHKDITMQPYKNADHGTSLKQIVNSEPINLTGYWCRKGIPNEVTSNKYFKTAKRYPKAVLRLADLYLLQAEANLEAYGVNEDVYTAVNKVRQRAGIPNVQDSWQNYSLTPSKVTTTDGMREIIRTERLIELTFEGQRFWDLRRWLIAGEYMNKPLQGWNVFGENSKTFYNNYEGPIEVWSKNKFEIPRDYFWPIRAEEIMISNIKQNLGW